MKRTLQLTSPLMKGGDVAYAKRLLMNNPFDVFLVGVDFDGMQRFDQETAAACREAKWMLGYAKDNCTGTFGTVLEKYLRGTPLPTVQKIRRNKRLKAVSVGAKAVDLAKPFIGTKEHPAGTNIAKPFTEWYGWHGWGAPWCNVFVSYFLDKAGFGEVEPNKARWAFCPYFLADARARRYGLKTVTAVQVKKGDIALFDWDNDGVADHIGFCTGPVSGAHVPTLEGNTSSDEAGDQSNGGEVCEKSRSTSDIIAFVRAG